MQDLDDLDLLRRYAARDDEAAFVELVSRHVGFVHSSALRQVRDPHLAGEIAQAVFTILAQKAGRISAKTILSAWLFKTTRYAALAQIRAEATRRHREQEVQLQTELESQSTCSDEMWERLSPLLDEALASLGEADRQAVLLRFFENRSLAEVGAKLGTGEDTARKRVTRALDKLHRYFSKHGVTSTAAIIAMGISANSVQAAPAALAQSVAAVAVVKGAAASVSTLTLIKGALKLMAWTKAKIAITTAAALFVVASTTTVVINTSSEAPYEEIFKHPTSRSDEKLEKAPPTVIFRPTRFPHIKSGTSTESGKCVYVNWPIRHLITVAYRFSGVRTILPDEVPEGGNGYPGYDFLATIPSHQDEALQEELKKQLGLVARTWMREADVWLLKVKSPEKLQSHVNKGEGFANFGNGMGFVQKHYLTNQPMSQIVTQFEHYFQKPIVDQTGTTNRYDFTIQWSTGDNAHVQKDLIEAFDKVGLELVPSREIIEMLVVRWADQ